MSSPEQRTPNQNRGNNTPPEFVQESSGASGQAPLHEGSSAERMEQWRRRRFEEQGRRIEEQGWRNYEAARFNPPDLAEQRERERARQREWERERAREQRGLERERERRRARLRQRREEWERDQAEVESSDLDDPRIAVGYLISPPGQGQEPWLGVIEEQRTEATGAGPGLTVEERRELAASAAEERQRQRNNGQELDGQELDGRGLG
jgi:hypothetical protein